MINLNILGNKWLEIKKQRMQNLLKIALPDEALYREIMLSLGYPNNKVNFLELCMEPIRLVKIDLVKLHCSFSDIEKIDVNTHLGFMMRPIHSIFTELGFDPSKPIREQEPNPLPDRKALDDIVFDALGLTEEERKEVYWAVAELVKTRLEKARSV